MTMEEEDLEVESERFEKVAFGTPLPELKGDELVRKKPLSVKDQIVTDENGRRRFHGAFTGGFSAGFFNTAGSRDGWTPKSFKSSRDARSKAESRKPEDFMDEEDVGEFGIAPKKFQTSSNFNQAASRNRDAMLEDIFGAGGDHAVIDGAKRVYDSLFVPVKETIGIRLLKEMGWRPGQGIGPRLKKIQKRKKAVSHKKMFSSGTGNEGPRDGHRCDEDDDCELYRDFLHAPDDVPTFLTKPKDNHFGIGYQGLERGPQSIFVPSVLEVDNGRQTTKGRPKSRKIMGQAFGVGAYEEEDEDIYSREDVTSNYDFYLDLTCGDDPKESRKKKRSRWEDVSGEEISVTCLEGFVSCEAHSTVKKSFPLPEIPKDFNAKCTVKKSRFEPAAEDVVSQEVSNPTSNHPSQIVSKVEPPIAEEKELRDFLNFDLDQKLKLNHENFKPYAKYPDKQLRYEKFLVCLKNGKVGALKYLQPEEMAEWEKEREQFEFERAALLYENKSSSSKMSNRFVSSKTVEELDVGRAVGGGSAEKILTDAEKAVKSKFFGQLTREQVDWHPAKILCIRFNVKQPYGDASLVGVPAGYKCKLDLFGKVSEAVTTAEISTKEASKEKPSEIKPETIVAPEKSSEGTGEDFKKASNDLFASIFLDGDEASSSDSSGEEDMEQEDAGKDEMKEEKEIGPSVPKLPVSSGLFANINFDSLTRKKPTVEAPGKEKQPVKDVKERVSSVIRKRPTASDFFDRHSDDELETYGPPKPKTPLLEPRFRSAESTDDEGTSDKWTEKTTAEKVSKSKSHKRSNKSKKSSSSKKKRKKSKSKKKSSKRRKRRSNSSSTSTSE